MAIVILIILKNNIMKFGFYISTIVFVLLMFSCDEFIEEELDEQDILQIAPAEGVSLTNDTVTFWWTEVEDIRGYNLQVVTPDFTRIERIVIDSVLTEDRFNAVLDDGVYEWRVTAFNAGSELVSDTFMFSVDGKMQGANSIKISTPLDGAVLSNGKVTFKWMGVDGVTDYHLQVVSPGFQHIESVVLDETLTEELFEYELSNGYYEWLVRGYKDGEEIISDTCEFKVSCASLDDQTISLKAPYDEAVLKDKDVSFWWTNVRNISGYQLQVVTPGFDKVEKVIVDDVLIEERFDYELQEGVYEWMVRAYNCEYELVSDTFRIEIISEVEQ